MTRITTAMILFVLIGTPARSQGPGRFETPDALSAWMTVYYQHPTPDRLVDAMRSASRLGLLRGATTMPPMLGFLAGWFSENGDAAHALAARPRGGPPGVSVSGPHGHSLGSGALTARRFVGRLLRDRTRSARRENHGDSAVSACLSSLVGMEVLSQATPSSEVRGVRARITPTSSFGTIPDR